MSVVDLMQELHSAVIKNHDHATDNDIHTNHTSGWLIWPLLVVNFYYFLIDAS